MDGDGEAVPEGGIADVGHRSRAGMVWERILECFVDGVVELAVVLYIVSKGEAVVVNVVLIVLLLADRVVLGV